MRPSLTRFTHSVLALALLVPLAGCGGNADAGDAEPSARLTLTGPLQADGAFDLDCNVYSDRGLQVTFATPDQAGPDQGGEEAAGEHGGGSLQIQVRINDYVGAGEYPVGIVLYEHEGHDVRKWTGWAVANIQRRTASQGGIQRHSAVSGSFEGTYQGQRGGHGTVRGTFQDCATRELIP